MKKILCVLLSYLLLATSVAIASTLPQAANVIQLGQSVNSATPTLSVPGGSLSRVKTLGAGSGNTTGGNFYRLVSFMSPGSTAQYQVPNGYTFYVTGIQLQSSTVDSIILGYGTAALGSEDTATPPTGVVYYAGSATGATFISRPASQYISFPVSMSFPQNSYPFVKTISSSHDMGVMLIGQEVAN